MRIARMGVPVLLLTAATSTVPTGASPQSTPAGPTFEVVSIKLVTERRSMGSTVNQRPDGGFTMTNIPTITLLYRAYPFATALTDMVGLPGWATNESYDVSATSSLSSPTPDQRTAMLRAMLADRFKLVVHTESRDQPVYDLVLARRDGRLGSGMTSVDVDCSRIAPPSSGQLPDFKLPPPPCSFRTVMAFVRDRSGDGQGALGDLLEGDTTMDNLALALRIASGRVVVNKTGLPGTYRLRMNFDSAFNRRGLGPDPAATPDAPPSVFSALPEQLGLRLESSTAPRDTLIIDRLERPSEN